MEKRKYTLRKRAETAGETRQRIVEATMALHEELGPRLTTISAIAERAGVQRLTVYRHFEDETALFQACTSCWLERHPPPPTPTPPPTATGAARPAEALTRDGLLMLYRYYAGTRRMWEVSYRDVDLVPALHGPMQALEAYLAAYRDALLAVWPRPDASALRATLWLAVRFTTWRTLADQGLDDGAMASLVARWAKAASAPKSGPGES